MAFNRTLPLEERIATLRAELDAFIEAKAEAEAKNCPGVPLEVIRGLITQRAGGCQCRQYLQIKKEDDAAKERENAG
jgi:hypothetical protein